MAAFEAVRYGSTDPDWKIFLLCKDFGWLPSEVMKEDWYLIEKMLMYRQALGKEESYQYKKMKDRKGKS